MIVKKFKVAGEPFATTPASVDDDNYDACDNNNYDDIDNNDDDENVDSGDDKNNNGDDNEDDEHSNLRWRCDFPE